MSTTNPGDVVVDPFFGTGTTGAVAKKLGRHFIGIERDPSYLEVAQRRIDAIEPVENDFTTPMPSPRRQARIGFGQLIEAGLINPGTPLFSRQKKHVALVKADGSVFAPPVEGSIHKVGASVQKAQSCNGWTFWHYENAGALAPIDDLRTLVRQGLN